MMDKCFSFVGGKTLNFPLMRDDEHYSKVTLDVSRERREKKTEICSSGMRY